MAAWQRGQQALTHWRAELAYAKAWLARAEEALGRKQHAMTLYRQASYERSYYGFLAADRVKAKMPFVPSTQSRT